MSSLLREAITPRDGTPAPEHEAPPVMEVVVQESTPAPLEPEAAKPLAVILVGDPQYLADPAIEGWAMPFYNEVVTLLKEGGYRIEFYYGAGSSYPNRAAAVWVSHDTGARHMGYAKRGIRKVYLETAAAHEQFESDEQRRRNQAHYQLSDKDIERLKALSLKESIDG
jgi:hypothetical protein